MEYGFLFPLRQSEYPLALESAHISIESFRHSTSRIAGSSDRIAAIDMANPTARLVRQRQRQLRRNGIFVNWESPEKPDSDKPIYQGIFRAPDRR